MKRTKLAEVWVGVGIYLNSLLTIVQTESHSLIESLLQLEVPLSDNVLPRAKILVVDDQPLNIKVAHQILQPHYEIYMATDAAQALAFCNRTAPDLILLDVVMPEMDGLTMCNELKKSHVTQSIPVIFVTANTSLEQEHACWQAGAVDFVCKPFNAMTLLHRVRSQILLKQQADQLRTLAYIDELTGIANRRALERLLNLEWRRSKREQQPLAAIMIDVDHFKRYNDQFGHLAGDDCLRQVAHAIRDACGRSHDVVARFGGEEFCCLMPGIDYQGVEAVGRKIAMNVAALAISHPTETGAILSVSMGGVSLVPTDDSVALTLISRADQQLYLAKSSGRNRICVEPESSDEVVAPPKE